MTSRLSVQYLSTTLREKFEVVSERYDDWSWYYFQASKRLSSPYFRLKHNEGIHVCDEDWDNLIILDACRYDVFEERIDEIDVPGRLRRRISRGSATPEFLKENFHGRALPDIVYVTANPFVHTRLDDPFFDTIHVWDDGWDDDAGTVLPETMAEMTIRAHDQYPNKRIIAHFMQPHEPFIGDHSSEDSFWELALKRGPNEAMKAYRSNLDAALPHVETLVEAINGKTVITSDHGNACGEPAPPFGLPIYGHPHGVHIPALVEIPWFITKHDQRKTVDSELSTQPTMELNSMTVEERLSHLGYR